ncbi:hypothetical protein D3C77_157530 [compost metagenome]|jgi:hypothetical protein
MDYPKSVPNVGLVDGKFVDEDPVVGLVGSLIPSVWGNQVTEELLNVIRESGMQPDESNSDQLCQAITVKIGQALSVAKATVGESRNARMLVSAASATVIFQADELIVKNSHGGSAWPLTNLNLQLNLGNVGAGGMDSGIAPVNGYVGIYVIYHPVAGMSGLLAVNATSAIVPEIYGGNNTPDGFTASCLVAVLPTDGTRRVKACALRGREVTFETVNVLSANAAIPTLTLINVGGAVPQNGKSFGGYFLISVGGEQVEWLHEPFRN